MVKSGSARTLYLDDELWNHLLRLVKSGYARNVSQLVNRLLADALGVVAKSDAAQEDFSYDMLRKKRLKLSRELISLEKQMKGYDDEYRVLIELSESLGLDIQELSNLDNVIAKLIGEWKDPTRDTTLIYHITGKSQREKTN